MDCPDLRTLLEQPSHSLLRHILEAVPCGAAVGLDGKIVFANEECAHMWGFDHSGEMKGIPFFNLIAPHWHELVYMLWSARGHITEPWVYELEGVRVDGEVFPYRITSVARDTTMGKATIAFFSAVDSCISPEEQMQRMADVVRSHEPTAEDA